jgi:hypothetical protein
LGWRLAGPKGEVVREDVDKDHREHQHYNRPDAPIPMGSFEEMVTWVGASNRMKIYVWGGWDGGRDQKAEEQIRDVLLK